MRLNELYLRSFRNYEEERLLRDATYQKKLAAAIGCSVLQYLEETDEV